MDNLYLYNTVEGVGEAHTYIDERLGKARLEDTRLTIVHPFYNERARFLRQFDNWMGWSDNVRDKVNIVLIDDGSPTPIRDHITKKMNRELANFNISIYRIRENLKWNTPGALNLGLTVAPTDWVLIMDSDCAFSNDNMETLLKADPEPFAIYKFPRQRLGSSKEDLDNRRYLPCTMLFHRSLFLDKLGGFDEDYTGHYSGGYAFFDTDFDERAYLLMGENPMFIWNDARATEWMPSMADGEIVERTKKEERINRELLYKKRSVREMNEDVSNPSPILRFNYDRVYHHERS